MFPTQPKSVDISSGFRTSGRQQSSRRRGWHKESTSYINNPSKMQEREKVLSFMLSNHKRGHLNVLTLPGERWIFEQMLDKEYPKSTFFGIEADPRLFETSKNYLIAPTNHRDKKVRHGVLELGEASIPYSNTLRKSRLLNMPASEFCLTSVRGYGASNKAVNAFKRMFCNNHAVWFDFTSQLCTETENTIRYTSLVTSTANNVPVVYTMLNARDSHSGVDSRVSRVCKLAGAYFDYKDHWTYQGMNNVPMLTVCGIMRKADQS